MYFQKSISKVPTNELFDMEINDTEDDVTSEEQNASETKGQAHESQEEIHNVEESLEVDYPEPVENEIPVEV